MRELISVCTQWLVCPWTLPICDYSQSSHKVTSTSDKQLPSFRRDRFYKTKQFKQNFFSCERHFGPCFRLTKHFSPNFFHQFFSVLLVFYRDFDARIFFSFDFLSHFSGKNYVFRMIASPRPCCAKRGTECMRPEALGATLGIVSSFPSVQAQTLLEPVQ